MTFQFKLSKRLAIIFGAAAVAAAAIGGCAADRGVSVIPPNSVVQVVVHPDSPLVDPGQSIQFQAGGVTGAGDSVAVDVTWSATAGQISAGGLFTADSSLQDGQVTATYSGSTSTTRGTTGTARIRKNQVVQVILSPATATLTTGGSQSFTAVGIRRNGSSAAITATFTATGGTITSGGQYTAGQTAGQFAVIAQDQTTGLADTSAVTVLTDPVALVLVTPPSASVATGGGVQLSAATEDSTGATLTGRSVTWSSSNTAVATVSASGMVHGMGPGSATITATSEGKSGMASVTVIPPPVPVASVAVSPASASVRIGSAVQLSAVTRDSAGNTLTGRTVTWSSSNTPVATVSATGLVSGVAAGNATITATSEGKTGSAGVTVTVVPVASVVVSPASASVGIGSTIQLSAVTKDSAGSTLTGRTVTWSSSNTAAATVSSGGLVSGVAAGTATVTATSEGKSGTASITVPSGGGGGGTILFQENFEDSSFASRGWYDVSHMTITTAEHVAGSTHSLEVHYLQGAHEGTWGGPARHALPATSTVYLSYWVKYSTNWAGSGHSYGPHEFYFLTTDDGQYTGPSFTHLTAYVEHIYQNGGIPAVTLQDGVNIDQTKIGVDLTGTTENRAANGCNGNLDAYATGCYTISASQYNNEKIWKASQPYFLPNPGTGYKNDWHFVEAYLQLNSISNGKGVADGIARYWFDGQLVIEKTGVLFRTGAHPTMQFNQFLIGPYIGDPGSPVDQTMWVDNLTVATAKP